MWRMQIFWLWSTASDAIFAASDSLYSEKTFFKTLRVTKFFVGYEVSLKCVCRLETPLCDGETDMDA